MERATVLTIPTIVHLMIATDASADHKADVRNTKDFFPQLLSLADDDKSVNAIWKSAADQFRLNTVVQFKLDDTPHEVSYQLRDFDLKEGEEIILECSTPPTDAQRRVFGKMQQKFGRSDFRGLQVFVLARVLSSTGENIGGCAVSQADGTVGCIWLDAPAVDPALGGIKILAHETGHILSLPHVPPTTSLMNKFIQGTQLEKNEVARANDQAQKLKNLMTQ